MSRQQAAGSRQQAAGSRQQAAGSGQQAADSGQQAAGSRQQAAGSRQQDVVQRIVRLKRFFVCCLLFAACSLLPAVCCLADIFPKSGTETGGDVVTISGLTPCNPCTTPTVKFDGVTSPRVTTTGSGTIQVITPPHAPGPVGITISPASSGSVSDAFTYVQRETLLTDNFERVLIPLSLGSKQFPGAYFSLWASELWIYNSNPWSSEILFGNPDANCCPSPVIAGAETLNASYVGSSQQAFGILVWLQKGSSRGINFSLQVRDVSRAKIQSGTEMPVVRESEFKYTIDLLNVPIDPGSSRTALRIFNLDGTTQLVPVHIVITKAGAGDVLADDSGVALRAVGESRGIPSFARYTSLDDLVLRYPQLAGAGPIEISVSTSGSQKIWAFAAVTNNNTQLITTVFPH